MIAAVWLSVIDWLAVWRWPLTCVYLGVLLVAAAYGLHRYRLVLLYWRTRTRTMKADSRFEALPRVTVQLPMYNEAAVAERVIRAACGLDYPREKLQVQVLDDSTDSSADVSRAVADRLHRQGHNVEFIHREKREGYKAGALQHGLASATGEFIAVFDADFVPPRDFLRRAVPYLADPSVGMVQGAWAHLNRGDSALTACQAIFLDSHFHIEHPARNRSGNWFNFNGTAGIWRRSTIEDAGGWQHDTLTEDMDLSYRAQLKGWRFVYLQDLACPAELPPEINAFKTQQHRWTKGTVQTLRKLMPRILRSSAPRGVKADALLHMSSPALYPCVVLIAVLMYPAVIANLKPFEHGTASAMMFGMAVLLLATASGCAFYVAGQAAQGRSVPRAIGRLPLLVAVGVGMSVNNTIAVLEAAAGRKSAFQRTPKFNSGQGRACRRAAVPAIDRRWPAIVLELGIGLYLTACLVLSVFEPAARWTSPFLLLFASGYLYVGLTSALGMGTLRLVHRAASPRVSAPTPTAALTGDGLSNEC